MPRTRVVHETVYQYAELSEKAKTAVRQKFADWDDTWDECPLEEFAQLLAAFGYDADEKDIRWESHPWNAAFKGRFSVLRAAQCEAEFAKLGWGDGVPARLAKELAVAIAKFAMVGLQTIIEQGDLTAEIDCTSNCSLRIDDLDWGDDSGLTDVQKEALNDLNDQIATTTRDLCRWFERQLDAALDHIYSEEYAVDMCEANDYEFDEYGNIV